MSVINFLIAEWDKLFVVVFTGLLAAFTFQLRQSTEKLWRETKASVDALPKIQRAYVFVEVKLEERLVGTTNELAESKVSVYIWNHGKTPAVLTKLRGYTTVLPETPQELIHFKGNERELPPGLVIAGSGYRIEQFTCRLSTDNLGDIERGDSVLYCAGRVEYEDVMGIHRETGFCWQYRPLSALRDFTISPNTKLNYRT